MPYGALTTTFCGMSSEYSIKRLLIQALLRDSNAHHPIP